MSDFIPLAVLGYGCVLPPTSVGVEAYWRNLVAGVRGISEPPPARWDADLFYSADHSAPDKSYCRYGGFLDDYAFEPAGRLSAAQEERMRRFNRSQLISADVTLQALTMAGYDADRLAGLRTELVMGNMLGDEMLAHISMRHRAREIRHYLAQSAPVRALDPDRRADLLAQFDADVDAWLPREDEIPAESVLSSGIAPAVADLFGIRGPVSLVDGACASGILVVDAAVQGLRDGSIDLAVAIGAMANMGVPGNVAFAKIGGLSPNTSLPLSAEADGLIPGEGAGALVLRRLDRALADGDPIRAVVRGVATRSDGKGKAIYAPSSRGQSAAMRRALDHGGLTARDIDHLETHATATPTGDGVEVASIRQVVDEDGRTEPLSLGSGKALIGHGFPSAGMANIVKLLAAFEHGQIAPTHGITTPNAALVEAGDRFVVHAEPQPWPVRADRPRRAMANAFGFGGVDSSIVVEQFDEAYHRQLAATIVPQAPAGPLAVVGLATATPGSAPTAGLPQTSVTRVDLAGYPAGRWHADAAAIYDPTGSWRGRALDFTFPFKELRLPPSVVGQMDRSQQYLLTVSKLALDDAAMLDNGRARDPERIATMIAAASGLEAALTRNLRIRLVEFISRLSGLPGYAALAEADRAAVAEAISAGIDSYIPATDEGSLPGYMDNISAGRAGNQLDLRGSNFVLDADFASFGAVVRQAQYALAADECDSVLIGGVNAVLAHDLLEQWERVVGEPLSPVESAVALVVRRADDVPPGTRVYGYLSATAGHVDDVRHPGGATSLGADGALWTVEQLRTPEPSAVTTLTSVFSGSAFELRVAATPDGARRPDGARADLASTGVAGPDVVGAVPPVVGGEDILVGLLTAGSGAAVRVAHGAEPELLAERRALVESVLGAPAVGVPV